MQIPIQQTPIEQLRDFIARLCVKAELEWERRGLPAKPRVTILMRDPNNEKMSVIVTNEADDADIGQIAAQISAACTQDCGRAGEILQASDSTN